MRWLRRAHAVQLCVRSRQLTAQCRVLRLDCLEIVFHLGQQRALERGVLLLQFGALGLDDSVVLSARRPRASSPSISPPKWQSNPKLPRLPVATLSI